MHVVVMGCGRVGASIAQELQGSGHDVSIIDRDATAFRRLPEDFGGTKVKGVGFDQEVLRRAGIAEADAFAAVSSGDNSNIIAARVARETFNVPKVVARIYDAKRAAVYERLGIPTVATVPWTTDRFISALGSGSGDDVAWTEPSGEVAIVQLTVHESWVGTSVTLFQENTGSRVSFINRLGRPVLPSAKSVLQQDDQVFVAALTDNLEAVRTVAAGVAPEFD
ncbi:potassium channel family protein [Williamsia muralis]|uniref:potassium channel family protein n=1 Tax=Williamsia marianensis TaxID=85044 RepID=UPI00380BD5AC